MLASPGVCRRRSEAGAAALAVCAALCGSLTGAGHLYPGKRRRWEPLRCASLAKGIRQGAQCATSPGNDEAPAPLRARVDAGELLPVKEKRGGSLFAGLAGCLPSPV